MKRKMAWAGAMVMLLALIGLFQVSAQSGGYDLTWHTIDNGGVAVRTNGAYRLGSAVGQPDAGVLKGETYVLTGGFWQSRAIPQPPESPLYLPLVLRQA